MAKNNSADDKRNRARENARQQEEEIAEYCPANVDI